MFVFNRKQQPSGFYVFVVVFVVVLKEENSEGDQNNGAESQWSVA